MADPIFRCSDGHLFTASLLKLVFMSLHLGISKFLRCPVDGKWRVASPVSPGSLSDPELRQARRHRF